MSKWADVYSTDGDLHTVPMDVAQLPAIHHVHKHVYGHLPMIDCPCRPHVRFSECGEYLVINHRDQQRGSLTAELETLQ